MCKGYEPEAGDRVGSVGRGSDGECGVLAESQVWRVEAPERRRRRGEGAPVKDASRIEERYRRREERRSRAAAKEREREARRDAAAEALFRGVSDEALEMECDRQVSWRLAACWLCAIVGAVTLMLTAAAAVASEAASFPWFLAALAAGSGVPLLLMWLVWEVWDLPAERELERRSRNGRGRKDGRP